MALAQATGSLKCRFLKRGYNNVATGQRLNISILPNRLFNWAMTAFYKLSPTSLFGSCELTPLFKQLTMGKTLLIVT